MDDSRQPPPPPKNNREHPRYELMASVELHQGTETAVLPAKNLSLGGIYLSADGNDLSHFEVGAAVEMLVFNAIDESHPPIKAAAHILRVDIDGIALRWAEDSLTEYHVAQLLEALR